MPNDFEQLLKDLFGEPLNRLTQFSSEQTQRLQTRLQEFAREAVKEELAKIHTELNELRERVVELEKERADNAANLV
jgi:predicted nuclease with TOPRIM domain